MCVSVCAQCQQGEGGRIREGGRGQGREILCQSLLALCSWRDPSPMTDSAAQCGDDTLRIVRE